jgi:hypothetical protein
MLPKRWVMRNSRFPFFTVSGLWRLTSLGLLNVASVFSAVESDSFCNKAIMSSCAWAVRHKKKQEVMNAK